MEICVRVEQEKHGAFYAYYKGVFLGTIDNLDVIEEIKETDALIGAGKAFRGSNLGKALNEKVEQKLAKLLAFYATEEL